jgi:hypothetical protein
MPDHIARAQFEAQFPRLILSSRELPRKRTPLHIVLISTLLLLDPTRPYTEQELNAELQSWILAYGSGFKIGHSELRRLLIDEGYLSRDPAGREYRVDPEGGTFTFDESLHQLDLDELIERAIEAREARKRAHTDSA